MDDVLDKWLTTHTSEVVCPWCFKVMTDSWELEEDDGTIVCGWCDEELSYSRFVDVTYNTWKGLEK